MNPQPTPTPAERNVSMVAAAILWVISLSLAIFTIAVADEVSVWVRAALVATAMFATWLLWFAPVRFRVAFVRWFPWC